MADDPRDADAPAEAGPPSPSHPPLDAVAEAAMLVAVSRELVHDARILMKVGAGTYEMELLKGSCRHGFRYHPTMAIAGFTRARMMAAMRELELDWELVTDARLQLRVTLEEKDPARGYKPMMLFGRYQGIYVLCRTEAFVVVSTGAGSWNASGRGAIDWPRDWGQLGL
ncbi:MAG TPA: hypothetical protein VG692_18440 [Gemmatimonadales bacterium]|nr:hypothetical protein [Gemmatimonadales bacterium]